MNFLCISYFNENIDWLKEYNNPHIIYNKVWDTESISDHLESNQTARKLTLKERYPEFNIIKETIGEVVGFNRVKNSEACEFVSSITGDNSREVVSFGTEAGLFQEIGISTVVCGPGSIEQAHKIDEYIELNEIKKCLSFLEGIKNKSVN